MKRYCIAILGGMVAFWGCKEIGPTITPPRVVVKDSTYVLQTVPAADAHNVLIEEFTGQSCPNCPAAHDELVSLVAQGNLNVLGLYCTGITQAFPPSGAANDFRTLTATDIASQVYGGGPFSGIPCAGVDRQTVSGSQILYSSAWPGEYTARKTIADSVNLSVSSTYNATDTTAQIVVLITYLYNMSTVQNLSIAITEDSIIDLQETPTTVDPNYVFTYVLRDFVTTEPYGDVALADSVTKVPGRVSQKVYNYKFPASKWNPAQSHVIAFVSNLAPNAEVLQSASTKLMGP